MGENFMVEPMPEYDTFAHGADVGVIGRGGKVNQAFENAAMALTSVITDPFTVNQECDVVVECVAEGVELLLVEWLNAVIYEMAAKAMLFSRYEVRIEGNKLTGKMVGEKVRESVHLPAVEVKGATFTMLKVERDEGGQWIAQTVVDV